uniref:Type III-B CRISPR module RAMP protein Cmr1 n=1 Tax=Desulfobacca acetoxidans TaxID=60893 RepID=A0A7V4LCA6_9BACT
MNRLTVTAHCRALTPMLAGGANPWEHFELRAAELKSALRFWWRAFHDFSDLKALYYAESNVFGGKILEKDPSGKVEEKALAAPFRLEIFPTSPINFFNPGKGEKPVRERNGSIKNQPRLGDDVTNEWGDGVRYIFYAILHHKGKIHNIATKAKGRQVAKQGFRFDLRFTFPQSDEKLAAEVLRALWLLMNLGGIGARTRRGAGCFVIESFTPDISKFSFPQVPEFSPQGYKDPETYLKKGLEVILGKWFPKPLPAYTAEPGYTAFRPGLSEIHVLYNPTVGKGSGALQAMDAVGCMMKKYRYINPKNEAQDMHQALHQRTTPSFTELTKAQFGLPIIYNFRGEREFGTPGIPSIFGGYTAQGVVYDGTRHDFADKKNADRRASPLLISCHQWTDGRGYAVICHFPAPLLPDGQKIWLKAKKDYPKSHHVCEPPPAYALVDAFIQGTDKSLDKGFARLARLWTRPGAAGAAGPTSGITKPPPPPPPPPADPQARKRFYLQQAKTRADGLPWCVGEISGPPQGQTKKQKWPCILWKLAGDTLIEEPGTWWLRVDKVQPPSERARLCEGTLFLCTNQADARTENKERYLYSFTHLP